MVRGDGCRVLGGWVVGAGGCGNGTVLTLFWHCFGTVLSTVPALSLPLPGLALGLRRPVYALVDTRVPRVFRAHPGHPCHLGYTLAPPRRRTGVHKVPGMPAVAPGGCGAHSWLHRWSESPSMSPGPLNQAH